MAQPARSPTRSPTRSPMSWLLLAALLIAASFTAFQVVRSVNSYIFWRIHADEPIQPWMTIGFVAHSYHIPPPVLHRALGLPPARDPRPLGRIARSRGMSFDTARSRLQYAIVHSRPPYPPPAPPTPAERPH